MRSRYSSLAATRNKRAPSPIRLELVLQKICFYIHIIVLTVVEILVTRMLKCLRKLSAPNPTLRVMNPPKELPALVGLQSSRWLFPIADAYQFYLTNTI